MKPAGSDPFPESILIHRGRRRSVELSLEAGQLIARAPRSLRASELEEMLGPLRARLWKSLRSQRVFDDEGLSARARQVRHERLSDLALPAHTVRFSSRQRKRWGSCTSDGQRGAIRISDRLLGHPNWILDHLILHELAHLVVPNHGPGFQRLMDRCPHGARAEGYLNALETLGILGPDESRDPLAGVRLSVVAPAPVEELGELPLFASPADRRLGTNEGRA